MSLKMAIIMVDPSTRVERREKRLAGKLDHMVDLKKEKQSLLEALDMSAEDYAALARADDVMSRWWVKMHEAAELLMDRQDVPVGIAFEQAKEITDLADGLFTAAQMIRIYSLFHDTISELDVQWPLSRKIMSSDESIFAKIEKMTELGHDTAVRISMRRASRGFAAGMNVKQDDKPAEKMHA